MIHPDAATIEARTRSAFDGPYNMALRKLIISAAWAYERGECVDLRSGQPTRDSIVDAVRTAVRDVAFTVAGRTALDGILRPIDGSSADDEKHAELQRRIADAIRSCSRHVDQARSILMDAIAGKCGDEARLTMLSALALAAHDDVVSDALAQVRSIALAERSERARRDREVTP